VCAYYTDIIRWSTDVHSCITPLVYSLTCMLCVVTMAISYVVSEMQQDTDRKKIDLPSVVI